MENLKKEMGGLARTRRKTVNPYRESHNLSFDGRNQCVAGGACAWLKLSWGERTKEVMVANGSVGRGAIWGTGRWTVIGVSSG